jgi:3-oxoacyl-[acyl-carrier protein] reductase
VDLAGRVALVTGGGTGLGRAIGLALGRSGAAVAVNYAHSMSEAREAVAALRALGVRADAFEADVSDWEAAPALVAAVESRLGPVDVLVNNAGITRHVPFDDLDGVRRDDWDRILAVNLGGAFACARAVAPGMRRRGEGRILNVASNSGLTAEGSSIPYVVSKAALIALTQALARGLAPSILVNAIAPGWMETRWLERYIPADGRARLAESPVPPVAVEHVAAAAVGLIANDAIDGEVLVVDRGERLHPLAPT